jgi:uncharacterized membrane protein YfhO
VPAGEHEIVLTYVPQTMVAGILLFLVGGAACLVLLASRVARTWLPPLAPTR